MTVAELIEQLLIIKDQNAKVVINVEVCCGGYDSGGGYDSYTDKRTVYSISGLEGTGEVELWYD